MRRKASLSFTVIRRSKPDAFAQAIGWFGRTVTGRNDFRTANRMRFKLPKQLRSLRASRKTPLRQPPWRLLDIGAAIYDRFGASPRYPRWRLMFAAGLCASTQSLAKDYVSRDVGGWTVAASQDRKGCFLTRAYQTPGETTLFLGLDIDGSNRLSVLNANWSIRERDRESLNFRLSNASFPNHLAIGMSSDAKKGFVAKFGEKFPTHFATSNFLNISRGEVAVEQLRLDGSGAAVAELRKCVELYQGKSAPDVRGSERAGHIPIDPFAPDAGRRPKKP